MAKKKLKRPAMPGAGRPAVYERPAKVSFLLEQDTLDRLDKCAAATGASRSDLLKEAVQDYIVSHTKLWL